MCIVFIEKAMGNKQSPILTASKDNKYHIFFNNRKKKIKINWSLQRNTTTKQNKTKKKQQQQQTNKQTN